MFLLNLDNNLAVEFPRLETLIGILGIFKCKGTVDQQLVEVNLLFIQITVHVFKVASAAHGDASAELSQYHKIPRFGG